jgi:hypothetical protein
MPGGHASHKGSGTKPNTNASGILDDAADSSLEGDELLLEGATTNTIRTQEFVDFPPALERPEAPENQQDEQ